MAIERQIEQLISELRENDKEDTKVKEFLKSIEHKMAQSKRYEKIIKSYGDLIESPVDITSGKDPSPFFYLLAAKLNYLLEVDPEKTITKEGIENRKKLFGLVKALGANFLGNKQVIENRNFLKDPQAKIGDIVAKDKQIILPDEPVIWTANHSFKDDTLASLLGIHRHAYTMFGSLPQFYNTVDGLMAWAVGVALFNRKVAKSRRSSVDKGVQVLNCGTDLFIFPEGVLNKTPNRLLLDLWPGVYRIAKETGAKIVPTVHYIRDCELTKTPNNFIHTVVDDPIRIDDLSEKAGLNYLRDVMATWYYLMMEKYGQSTRVEEVGIYKTSQKAWEAHLRKRIAAATWYDREIEYFADYRPKTDINNKQIILPEDVFAEVAQESITEKNKEHIEFAKQLIKTRKENDFQRRF